MGKCAILPHHKTRPSAAETEIHMSSKTLKILALAFSGEAIILGVIGGLLHYCNHIPMIITLGVLCAIFALFSGKKLPKIVLGILTAATAVGQLIFNFVETHNLHTEMYAIFCVATILFVLISFFGKNEKEPKAEKPVEKVEEPEKSTSYYEILKTTDGKFIFRLNHITRKLVAESDTYSSTEEVRKAIKYMQKLAPTAEVEDRTKADFNDLEAPKYQIYLDTAQKFRTVLINENNEIFAVLPERSSRSYAKKLIETVIESAATEDIRDLTNEEPTEPLDSALFNASTVKEETEAVISTVRATTDRDIREYLDVALPDTEGVEVVGIVFPERDRVYFYTPEKEDAKYNIGDVVLVPTLNDDRIVGVAVPNIHMPEDKLVKPLKAIINVVARAEEKKD